MRGSLALSVVHMEAVNINNNSTPPPLETVLRTFFQGNTPESVQLLFWRLFQCWVVNDCAIGSGLMDADLALVFDQLNELVAAAYLLHLAGNSTTTEQKGAGHA